MQVDAIHRHQKTMALLAAVLMAGLLFDEVSRQGGHAAATLGKIKLQG